VTPERWKRIEELYHAASALPSSERAPFIADACGTDSGLRQQVETLLNEPVSGDGIEGWKPIALITALHANMTGRLLGGYQLQDLLGSGGMGEVYRAHDASLGRDVAVKILPAAFASDPDRLARLEREARTLASLNHPNICAIYGVGEAEGIRFLVLELVDGHTLAERLADATRGGGALGLEDATTIARQIIEALGAAHERGIVHRDLKPANVKITPDGIVKLVDFGLAKAMGPDTAPGLTHAPGTGEDGARGGAVLGTAAYMSPEQARGLALDGRTDVWAFGCVLFEMLAGRPAFAGDTASDTIAKILEREPDWSALPRTTPVAIRRLLLRCLIKDSRKRLKDIADARLELDGIGDAVPVELKHGPTLSARRRRPVMALLPWLGLAALASGVLVREARRPLPPPENPLEQADYSKITDWEGTESGAVISPDGQFALFVSDRDRRFDLFLTQIGTNQEENLTKDGPPVDPQGIVRNFGFTADGEIWFTPGRAAGQQVRTMPLTGRTQRVFLGKDSTGVAWSNDGTRLAYFDFVEGDPVFVADRTGADAVQILRSEKGRHNHHLVWSPDDQWIYFVSGYLYGLDGSEEMDVWRIRPSGGEPERMTRLNVGVRFLTPFDPTTWLFVAPSANREGPWLWTFGETARVPRRVSSGLEQYTSVSASRDGRRIVATLSNTKTSLWRVPLRDEPVAETEVRPYLLPSRVSTPRFGRDSLFYLSTGSVGADLFRHQEGTPPVQIWSGADGGLSEAPAVSPDGQQVALMLRKDGLQQLAVMAADGTGRRRVAQSIGVRGAPDWSPDGTFLVVGGTDTRGAALFRIPLDGAAPQRIVDGDAVDPVVSADGAVVVFGSTIVRGVAPLRAARLDGTPVSLPRLRARPGSYRFTRAGRTLIYIPTAVSPDFWSFDFATGTTTQVTRLDDLGRLRAFDISPDGKWILFDRSTEQSDAVLITREK
jgi:serine/threonine protein kinase